MDSELPHCTICLKPTTGIWRCAEHSDIDIPEVPMPNEPDDLIERLRERNRQEASRRNSAYDHFGMDNTPQNTDPDVWEAANQLEAYKAEIEALREGLRLFDHAAHPVATEINPRGYDWCEAYLDGALKHARTLIKQDGR